jgi:hypothetical protein
VMNALSAALARAESSAFSWSKTSTWPCRRRAATSSGLGLKPRTDNTGDVQPDSGNTPGMRIVTWNCGMALLRGGWESTVPPASQRKAMRATRRTGAAGWGSPLAGSHWMRNGCDSLKCQEFYDLLQQKSAL